MADITRAPRGAARLFLTAIAFLFASSAPLHAQPAPALRLIPMPRQVQAGAVLSLDHGVLVRTGSLDAEDRFTADDLRAAIEEHGVSAHTGGPIIDLLRTNTASARAMLAAAHLTFDPAMHDEGYVIVPQPHELAVIADTSAGLFYGAQTVKQLIIGNGDGRLSRNRHHPRLARAPASRPRRRSLPRPRPHARVPGAPGPHPRRLQAQHLFALLRAHPRLLWLASYRAARRRHVTRRCARPSSTTPRSITSPSCRSRRPSAISITSSSTSSTRSSPKRPTVRCSRPVQPGSLALIKQWFTQITQQFPSPWVHIGADETVELGKGQTKDLVAQRGLDQVYVDFLRQIDGVIRPTGKRVLFWGDLAWHSPDLVAALPKDMIGVPWVYDALPDFDKYIRPFNRAGMEVWVAPGVNNWRRVYPDNNVALVNIQHFVRDGQRMGARGMLNTVWNDDGEGIFDEDWYGVLFGAAASWQPGESPLQQFATSYGAVFHGDLSGKIDKAQGQIMAAQKLLSDNGFRFGASNALFWEDPWSPAGQQDSAKLLPILKDLRLYAENAIILIDEARAANPLRQQDALDALALGARRIDFIGMKFQFADEIAHAYADAYSEAATPHSRAFSDLVEISNANGRCQDLRDGYTLTRELFEQAWRRDNRPYWLENVLAQYDMATQLWIARARQFDTLRAQLSKTHTLPKAEEIGVPVINGD